MVLVVIIAHASNVPCRSPSAVDRDTVDHVMQVVLNHDWLVAKAVPSALESVALSLSRVRPPDIGGLER